MRNKARLFILLALAPIIIGLAGFDSNVDARHRRHWRGGFFGAGFDRFGPCCPAPCPVACPAPCPVACPAPCPAPAPVISCPAPAPVLTCPAPAPVISLPAPAPAPVTPCAAPAPAPLLQSSA